MLLKKVGLIVDGIFISIVITISFTLSYLSAQVFKYFAEREISPSSGSELGILLTPWILNLIYLRYLYIYFIKKRMGILKDFGFWKSKQRKIIPKPSS